jgi:transcriptional regulator with XRE-family HTH domain
MRAMHRHDTLRRFGRTVRSFRTTAGLSQEDLADRAEIHRTYIGGIERGERNPTLMMICRLAEALEIRPSQLLESDAGDAERRYAR